MMNIIVAIDKDNGIGKNGKIPWYDKEDMSFFKNITTGHVIIMGRLTYQSIGRPLPNRTNVVITKDSSLGTKDIFIYPSLDEAVEAYATKTIFFIGGCNIYREAFKYRPLSIYVTRIDGTHNCDVFFPYDMLLNYNHITKLNNRRSIYKFIEPSITKDLSLRYTMCGMPNLSDEQQAIVDAFDRGENIIVDSVAGSGKTTTIFNCIKSVRALILTYNRKLKEDCRAKLMELNLNSEVHSYHSASVKFYGSSYKDEDIKLVVESDDPPIRRINFEAIIMDEYQDVSLLYYKFIKKIIRDNINKNIQLLVIGDSYQNIYSYNGTDPRYLSMADILFGGKWNRYRISTSFRVTKQIARFVNSNLFAYEHIRANKDGPPVEYYIMNIFSPAKISEIICNYIIDDKYKPEDFFILAYTVTPAQGGGRDTAINNLENSLTYRRVPIAVRRNDLDKHDETGKLVISTIHQAKGLEKKVVIVMGFDDSIVRTSRGDSTLNLLYVACTRATEKLILVHHNRNNYVSIIKDFSVIHETSNVFGSIGELPESKPQSTKKSVLNLCKYLNVYVRERLSQAIAYTTLVPQHYYIDVLTEVNTPNITKTRNRYPYLCEYVGHLYGSAIPAYYELITSNSCRMIDLYNAICVDSTQVKNYLNILLEGRTKLCCDNNNCTCAHNKFDELMKLSQIENKDVSMKELMLICNMVHSAYDKLYHKLNQISHYGWVDEKCIHECAEYLGKHISPNAKFEYCVSGQMLNYEVDGCIDILDIIDNEVIIWELKFTSELTLEHMLQLAIYAHLYGKPATCKLMNLRTGEILEIKSNLDDGIMHILLDQSRYGSISDEEFLRITM